MAVATRTVIDSFREAIQDLLVPELKALRVSMDSVRTEMHLSIESLRAKMRLRDEKTQDSVHHLSEKLDFAIDIRERLAALEAGKRPRHRPEV